MKSTHRAGDPESKIVKTVLGKKVWTKAEIKPLAEARGVEYQDGDESRCVEYIASTEKADREGDIVVMAGGDFTDFMKNPVFMWAHDYGSIPLGKILQITVDLSNKLKILVLYQNVTDEAKDLCQLSKLGYVIAVSIGFRAKMNGLRFPNEGERAGLGMRPGGVIFEAWELYEVSLCPIGMNPDALRVRALNKKSIALLKGEQLDTIVDEEEIDMKPDEVKKEIADGIKAAIPDIVTAVKAAMAPVPADPPEEAETPPEKEKEPAESKAFEALAQANPSIYGHSQKTGFAALSDRLTSVKA